MLNIRTFNNNYIPQEFMLRSFDAYFYVSDVGFRDQMAYIIKDAVHN